MGEPMLVQLRAPRRVSRGTTAHPPRESRPLHFGLAALVALAAGISIVEWAWLHHAHLPYASLLGSYGFAGLAYVAVGGWVWALRPLNRTGLLLMVAGFALIASAAGNLPNRWAYLVGSLVGSPIVVLIHLVLTVPTGVLRERASRLVVAAFYVLNFALAAVSYVCSPDSAAIPRLHVEGHSDVPAAIGRTVSWVGLLFIAVAAILVRRWRAHRILSERRALGAVHAYGFAVLLFMPLSAQVLEPVLGWSTLHLFGAQLLAIAVLPFVFAAAVLSGALSRTIGMGELATWLASPASRRPSLREALVAAIGDPSVELLYEQAGGGFVDHAGAPVSLPGAGVRRQAVLVELSDGRAAVLYDSQLIGGPRPVEAAARVAALAIEHERLAAELTTSRLALEESRRQAFERADEERRRLARDLHDGVQSRLVLAAMRAGQLEAEPSAGAASRLHGELTEAIDELRLFVHGALPPLLEERGLFEAVEDLVDRVPLPIAYEATGNGSDLPPSIATAAYFVVAEALTNVLKHASARSVVVKVRVAEIVGIEVRDDGCGGADATGGGLAGLAARAEALGGRLVVDSPPGAGTAIRAELPCGW